MHRNVWQFASREEPRGNKRTEARWERRQLGLRRIKASLWLRNLLRGKPWELNPFFCLDSSQKESHGFFYRNTPRIFFNSRNTPRIFINSRNTPRIFFNSRNTPRISPNSPNTPRWLNVAITCCWQRVTYKLCVHQASVVPRRMNFFASLTFESIDIINLSSLHLFALGLMQSYNLDICFDHAFSSPLKFVASIQLRHYDAIVWGDVFIHFSIMGIEGSCQDPKVYIIYPTITSYGNMLPTSFNCIVWGRHGFCRCLWSYRSSIL